MAGRAKASATVVKILRILTTTVQGPAELRNQLGLGRGRTAPSPALARHARLALNSTVTVTEFVIDPWQDRIERGKLPPRSSSHHAQTLESGYGGELK